MTAKYNYGLGEVHVMCDDCGAEDNFSGDDFKDAMSMAKMSGWSVRRVGNGWENRCPECDG